MKVTGIPFVSHIGIVPKDADVLMLPNYAYTQNHLQTIHAGAQYTLAETQSGYFLQNLFPKYRDKVIPLLRSCEIKYKQPATTEIYARAFVEEEAAAKFLDKFEKKGRALINVTVEVYDVDDVVTMRGVFSWFVQRM